MSFSRLYYHFVWATKEREPLITDANRPAIYAALAAKVDELRGIVHALNGMPDHVHLVVTVPPTIALATFIGQVKGSASHLATHRHSRASDRSFGWQAEYGVISISERHVPIVVDYVRRQQEHHANHTLNRTLESCERDR